MVVFVWMCIKIFSFLYSVSLDEDEEAVGSLFYDDGESLGTVEQGEYFLGEVTMKEGEIRRLPSMGWCTLSGATRLGV